MKQSTIEQLHTALLDAAFMLENGKPKGVDSMGQGSSQFRAMGRQLRDLARELDPYREPRTGKGSLD